MTRGHYDQFEYEIALSFAGEATAVAEEFANLLINKNIRVFYDEYEVANANRWGKDTELQLK
jgi:hypothetical protein